VEAFKAGSLPLEQLAALVPGLLVPLLRCVPACAAAAAGARLPSLPGTWPHPKKNSPRLASPPAPCSAPRNCRAGFDSGSGSAGCLDAELVEALIYDVLSGKLPEVPGGTPPDGEAPAFRGHACLLAAGPGT
jgi:hypothetical protein